MIRCRRCQEGQTTVFVLGLALVCMAIAGVAVDGTRAFLFRRSLQNAADAAALAGASEIDRATYYREKGDEIEIDVGAARARASEILALRGLEASSDIHAQSDRVVVILRSRLETTFLTLVGVTSLPVAVEADSAPVGEGSGWARTSWKRLHIHASGRHAG